MIKIVEIPIEVATTPKDGEVLVDRWWVLGENNDTILMGVDVAGMYPQCNRDKNTETQMAAKAYPGREIDFMPLVFLSSCEPLALAAVGRRTWKTPQEMERVYDDALRQI